MRENELIKLRKRDFFSKENNFMKNNKIKSILIYGKHYERPPFVTVYIPTYRRPNLIRRAIDSVLSQKYFDDYQLLIIDNECVFDKETETEKVIKSYKSDKIIYYRNKQNLGSFGNWNRAIELAQSKWICMLHDDDMLVENHLFIMTNAVKQNSQIDILSCRKKDLDLRFNKNINFKKEMASSNNNEILKKIIPYDYKRFNFGFKVCLLGALAKRECALDIGGFQLDSSNIEDYFFTAKFAYYYKLYELPSKLYCYYWQNNDSLNGHMWQDQVVYEYYFYKYISKKRCRILRPIFYKESKYKIIDLVNSHNDGTSFLKMKCGLNIERTQKDCDIKVWNKNKIIKNLLKLYFKIYNKFLNANVRRKCLKLFLEEDY